MNSFEFWAHMQSYAQMSRLWWFTFAALPAMIVAGGAYLLMAFGLRRKRGAPIIFFWLMVASVPALLTFPSFYVSTSLDAALAQVSFHMPASAQEFPLTSARQIGAALDTLGLYGIVGAALSLVVLFAASLVGEVPVASQYAQHISQAFTKAMTRAVNPGRKGTLSGQHGVLRVIQGSASGTQYVVRSGTIGKQEADILITDTIISRHHARLDVSDAAVRIADIGSTNGTYVVRGGQEYEIPASGFDLAPNDTIFLGPPSMPTAVALTYEKSGA